jgi:hypothetical protein
MNLNKRTLEIAMTDDEGYILKETLDDQDDDSKPMLRDHVEIIQRDNTKDSLKALLEAVAEWTGYNYDKFGKENLTINFEGKGHKVCCDDLEEVSLCPGCNCMTHTQADGLCGKCGSKKDGVS